MYVPAFYIRIQLIVNLMNRQVVGGHVSVAMRRPSYSTPGPIVDIQLLASLLSNASSPLVGLLLSVFGVCFVICLSKLVPYNRFLGN